MSLNESIVEEAALEWFGELGYAVGHGPNLAPGEPAAERNRSAAEMDEVNSFGEVVQSRCARPLTPALSQGEREKRESIRHPAGAGLPKLLSGKLSVAGMELLK